MLLVVALLTAFAVGPVFAAPILVTYTFTGSPGNQASEPVDSNPVGALFSDITRGPGIIANAGMNSINSRAWTTAASPGVAEFDAGFMYGLAFARALDDARIALDRMKRRRLLKLAKGNETGHL